MAKKFKLMYAEQIACMDRHSLIHTVHIDLYYLLNMGLAYLAGLYTDSVTVNVTENEMRIHTLSARLHNRMPSWLTRKLVT